MKHKSCRTTVGLTRQSIHFRKKMDARVEPAHDGGEAVQFDRDRL